MRTSKDTVVLNILGTLAISYSYYLLFTISYQYYYYIILVISYYLLLVSNITIIISYIRPGWTMSGKT